MHVCVLCGLLMGVFSIACSESPDQVADDEEVDTSEQEEDTSKKEEDTSEEETDSGIPDGGDVPKWSVLHHEFALSCVMIGCHSTSMGQASGGLNMSTGLIAYEKFQEPARQEQCEGNRMVPGDTEASILLKRLEGIECGPKMPSSIKTISPDVVADVRKWIEAGAPNDMPVLTDVTDAGTAKGPTFTQVYEEVLKPKCGGLWCHDPWQSPDETRYDVADKENAYHDHVNVMGVCQGNGSQYLRVKPGDPDNSQLVLKLENKGCPMKGMPVNVMGIFTPLREELIQMVRDWISNGAANN